MRIPVSSGFTLVEVLLAVLISSLLLTLALPGYRDSVLRAGRTEGHALLLRVAAEQERYYSRHNQYSQYADPFSEPPGNQRQSAGGRYEAELRSCDGRSQEHCFVAVAMPLGSQQRDDCGELRLWSTGLRDASGGNRQECW